MMNVTRRIALEITNLPPFEFSWGDLAPQKPRSCLTVDDLMPSSADGRELFDRACKYVARFLVEQFVSLKDLQKLLPHHTATGRTHKSVVVPMRMLERDEKYTDETIKILQDYRKDCGLTGEAQVNTCTLIAAIVNFKELLNEIKCTQIFIGDQCTCKNMRGAKRWASGELEPINQLQWALEVPGK